MIWTNTPSRYPGGAAYLGLALAISVSAAEPVPAATTTLKEWPIPIVAPYPSNLRTHALSNLLQTTLLGQDAQFGGAGYWKTYDYQNPRRAAYPDGLRTTIGLFPGFLAQTAPLVPNPSLLITPREPYPINLRTLLVGGWTSSPAIPFTPNDASRPYAKPYPSNLRTQVSYYVLSSEVPIPRHPRDWSMPIHRVYPIGLRFGSGLVAAAITIPALPPQAAGFDMPVPRRALYAIGLRTLIGPSPLLIAPLALPPQAFDWPIPRQAPFSSALRSFLFVGPNLSMLLPQTPFVMLDWPLPQTAIYPSVLRSFLRTTRLGIVFRAAWAEQATVVLGLREVIK